jgi:hypothetical protein
VHLAAARFEPAGLVFSSPVSATFALLHGRTPGTTLELLRLDEDTGELVVEGTAVVDETGTLATAELAHFSTFVVAGVMSLSYRTAAAHLGTLATQLELYVLQTPPDIELLEGLSVPILVSRRNPPGPEAGPGPFRDGMVVTAVLEGPGAEGPAPWVGPIVQPSADGWKLGTVLHLPVLPSCQEGETIQGRLLFSYDPDPFAPDVESIDVPFEIGCLNELRFDGSSSVDDVPLPDGARAIDAQETFTVVLEPARSYRFSEIHVGEGGILVNGVGYVDDVNTEPTRITVTGDVRIAGELRSRGSDGRGGGDGSGNNDGGAGGGRVAWHGAAGGQGGPICVTNAFGLEACDFADGLEGSTSIHGGAGGEGGVGWEQGSWFALAWDVGWVIYDLVSEDYVSAVQDAYSAGQEAVRIYQNDDNFVASAGEGGRRGRLNAPWDIAVFYPPQGGGGGGGSGKLYRRLARDRAGGGGGGGGGGASNLQLIVGGRVVVEPDGTIRGDGGKGGRGGDGAGDGDDQAAPAGGGAGGAGAAIHVVAVGGFVNNGVINARGGRGGLSGEVRGEINGEERIVLVESAFGQSGNFGILRVDGDYSGSDLQYGLFYHGPDLGRVAFLRRPNQGNRWCRDVFKGHARRLPDTPQAWAPYEMEVCLDLVEGLNTRSVSITGEVSGLELSLHPWQDMHVFYFPGTEDSDEDGLTDGYEAQLGCDPEDPDTDDDGYSDSEEVYVLRTDPTVPNRYSLTVQVFPPQGGAVAVDPEGTFFAPAASVSLTAIPDATAGYEFVGWFGDVESPSPTLNLSMESHTTVSAHFVWRGISGAGWESPEVLAVDAGSVTERSRAPQPVAVIDDEGIATVLWREYYYAGDPPGELAVNSRIWTRRSTPAGGWAESESVSSTAGLEYYGGHKSHQDLAVDADGNITVVFLRGTSYYPGRVSERRLYGALHLSESGWVTPYRVIDDTRNNSSDVLVRIAPTGRRFFVWEETGEGIIGISHPQTSWTSWDWLGTISPAVAPALAIDEVGYPMVACDNYGGSSGRTLVVRSSGNPPAQLQWDTPFPVGSAALVTRDGDPRLATGGNDGIVVAWKTEFSAKEHIFASFHNADRGWSEPMLLSGSLGGSNARVGMDASGRSLVAWAEKQEDGTAVLLVQENHPDELWEDPLRVDRAPVGENILAPDLAVSASGHAALVWLQSETAEGGETVYRTWASHRSPEGEWEEPSLLGDSNAPFPRVSMNAAGDAVAVWPVRNGAQLSVHAVLRFVDTDGDGLDDIEERRIGSDPTEADTDADRLSDGEEVQVHGTEPTLPDSDDDLAWDGFEIESGTDPLDPGSYPAICTPPVTADADGDALTDCAEASWGTDPLNHDTDGDTWWDGFEVAFGTDPLDPLSRPAL